MISLNTYLFFKKGNAFLCKQKNYFIILLLIFSVSACYSQTQSNYDEISVTVTVPRIGSWEMPAIIIGQSAYLPVKDFFDVLQIKNSASENLDSITGFFINPKANYFVDKINNRIVYQEKIFNIRPEDFIHFDNNLYLKSDYFGQVFGLECIFNFRSLSVTVNTKIELPAIREMQLEQMRRNISKLKGDKKADTTIRRKFSLFHLGAADWSVINFRQMEGFNYTRATANIGAILAGGEATAYLNYTSGQAFDLQQQYFRWRYVNNDNKVIRQITAGNIFVQTTASVYGAITGVQIANTPTTYRRSFGTYRLTNTTEPNWVVELYVNDILVNYTKADASGFFTFDVPLMYGNTVVKLKFYGPWGEERTREENISIPFNFLPLHEFEYNLSAGVVNDEQKSKFSKLNFNYGLGRRITIGSGIEYLSSISQGKAMPFINASARLGSNILISAEHTYGVRSKAVINYHLPSSLQLEIDYIKYVPGQTAIRSGLSKSNNYLEDKKIILFMPYRRKKFAGFSRFSFSQLTLPGLKYTTAELLLSGIYAGINTNFTTSAVYSDPQHPLLYSNLATSLRVIKGIRFTPQVQYEYIENKVSMIKCELEKSIWNKGFITLGYEKNLTYQSTNFSAGIKYNFSFAQTSVSVSQIDDKSSFIQSARGSIVYDDRSGYLKLNDQSNVGRGGIIIKPYLDFNCNGKRDEGEPLAPGLKLRINGGHIIHRKDTSIIITGLDAYANYFVDLDKNSFDNIGWQLKKPTMNVVIEPDHFVTINVAVAVVGEVSGNVYSQDNKSLSGLGRIIVNFYNSDSVLVAKTLTESDGFFSYVGLAPGNYIVKIDNNQLTKLKMSSLVTFLPVVIKQSRDGDVADGLKFIIKKIDAEEINNIL